LPSAARRRRGARAGRQGPARRCHQDRRGRRLPHRPAHHRGAVGRGDAPRAALHARPRERRLGARDRLRGHQRGRRRHGDPAPDADLRAVPRLPGRQRHALHRQFLPRPVARRRDGRVPAQIGAHHTVVADGTQAGAVRELTAGRGAQVVLDFVAEQGAEADGWAMTGSGGSYFVIGYGGTVQVPTLDIISTERNIIGNIVGTYNDLAELMALAEGGRVTLHTRTYPLDAAAEAFADLDAGRVRGRAILVP